MTRFRIPLLLAGFVAAALCPAAARGQPSAERLPRISIEPEELTFDKPGDGRSFTIANVGAAPLEIREVRLGPGSDQRTSLRLWRRPVQPQPRC